MWKNVKSVFGKFPTFTAVDEKLKKQFTVYVVSTFEYFIVFFIMMIQNLSEKKRKRDIEAHKKG